MWIRVASGLVVAVALGAVGAAAVQFDLYRARFVVDRLDRVVQSRFQDDEAGVFGYSRLLVLPGHEGVASGRFTDTELRHVKAANAANVDYEVSFLSVRHALGRYKGYAIRPEPLLRSAEAAGAPLVLLSISRRSRAPTTADRPWEQSGAYPQQLSPPIDAAVRKHLPAVRAGRPAEAVLSGRILALRPVRAEKRTCLGCHTGAKQGDTLGVMVYSVARNPLRDPRAAGG